MISVNSTYYKCIFFIFTNEIRKRKNEIQIQIQKAQFSDQTSEKEIVYALDEVMLDA